MEKRCEKCELCGDTQFELVKVEVSKDDFDVVFEDGIVTAGKTGHPDAVGSALRVDFVCQNGHTWTHLWVCGTDSMTSHDVIAHNATRDYRRQFLNACNEAYAKVRSDLESWKALQAER